MVLRPALMGLVFVCLQGSGQDEEPAKTQRPPRLLVLATAEEAAAGLLSWSTDESIALLTDRGERVFRWEDLRPYSAWRARSILAERDAAKRTQLAEYCREQKLFREARWEFGAARAIDPAAALPDLEELRKLDADSFMPGALGMAPTAVAKQLEKESADALAARGVAEQKRQSDRKKELGVTDVKTLVWQGDTSRRLDIVFACDGWTEAEQPKYHGIVDQLVKAVVKVDPMANYPSYINFHRISIVEAKSGIGGKTRLGSKVEKGILTCSKKAAWEVASLAPDADLVFVVSNVKDVRSTGGSGVLTLASDDDMNDTAIHELGHAFADLDDEYVDDSVQERHPAWDPADEPQHINTTQISDPKKVKWHYWNNPPAKGQNIGCYEGAYYREKGFYRPASTCRMRDSSDPLCAICFEAMEKALYALVSPIDDATPLAPAVRGFLDDDFAFSATAVLTEGKAAALGSLAASWYVNGIRDVSRVSSKDKTTGLKSKGHNLKAGRHEVALRVDFQNKRVRRDDGLLSGHRVWDLEVLPYTRPKLVLAGDAAKGPVSVKLEGAAVQAGVKCLFLGGPPGADMDASGSLTVLSDPALAGARVIRFGLVDAKQSHLATEDRTLALAHADGRNLRPFLRIPPEIESIEGKALYARVQAWDPDGDLLAFSAAGLPEGASIDPLTGELYWDPGYAQGGRYEGIKITATDGFQTATATTCFVVQEQPIASRVFDWRSSSEVEVDQLRGFDIILGLRCSVRSTKEASIGQLPRYGTTFRAFEYARLLRDRDPEIVALALAGLEGLLDTPDSARLRSMLMGDIEPHAWHFTDAPKVLEFLNLRLTAPEGLDSAGKQKADAFRKLLKAVAAYNKSRGL